MEKKPQTSFTLKLSCHPSVKYNVNAIEKLVADFINSCGLTGNFSGHAGDAKRASCHVRKITVERYSETGVLIFAKPNGNGSRCGIWITLPKNFSGKSENFFEILREKSQDY